MDNNQIMEQLRNRELELFDAFSNVCDRLNIDYYAIGGTLLGAVRHSGFIPWDDDIDVGILRKDYERFITNAQRFLPSNMFLQTNETDREYPMRFAKIRMNNTTFIETSVRKRRMNHGIYIDVFPIDYYPESKIRQLVWCVRERLIGARLSTCFDIQTERMSVKDRCVYALSCILYSSVKRAQTRFDECLRKEKESGLVRNYSGAWGSKEIVPADYFRSQVTLSFENRKIKAPIRYNEYLSKIYGDYMKLPPKEKQIAHHYTEVIDVNRSYIEYLDGKE